MTVNIKEVLTKQELRRFVDYPNQLYKDVPQFIPAMYGDDLGDWNRKKNPAFAYCDAKCFLAYKDGKIVGRIGAILSYKANETWHTNRMRFSQVDFIDDAEVADALFKAVEDYAAKMGCDEVHGPLGFCDLDREGMLVEGFERKGMFITYYNHPYYNTHLSRLGYVKDVDWVEDLIEIPYDEKTVTKLKKLSDFVMKHNDLHVVNMKSRKDYKPYVRKLFALLNISYANLYGVVELSDAQINKYADKFIPLINPSLVCIVEDGEKNMIAFGVSAPSMASALKKSRGRLFPFGFIGVLRSLEKNDTLDLLLVTVHPAHQGRGVNAIIMNHILEGCHGMQLKFAETGPQLEMNTKVQAQWRFFNKEQHKLRRCYLKALNTQAKQTADMR